MEFAFQKFFLQCVKCNNTAYEGNKLVDYKFIDSPKCNEQGESLCQQCEAGLENEKGDDSNVTLKYRISLRKTIRGKNMKGQ